MSTNGRTARWRTPPFFKQVGPKSFVRYLHGDEMQPRVAAYWCEDCRSAVSDDHIYELGEEQNRSLYAISLRSFQWKSRWTGYSVSRGSDNLLETIWAVRERPLGRGSAGEEG